MKKHYYFIFLFIFLACTAHSQWNIIPQFGGDERDGAFSFVINDTAYVGGGILSRDMWQYNPVTQQWKELGAIADGAPRCFSASFVHAGKGYIIGGDSAFGNAVPEVWSYNPVGDVWTKKANFPGGKRVGMVAWVLDNRVFVGGGCTNFSGSGFSNGLKDFYEYFPATDTWQQLTNLPYAAGFSSGFVLGGKLYLVFGSENNSTYLNSMYAYDTATKLWAAKTSFPASKRNGAIAFALNGKGYAGLGQLSLNATFKDFYEYNPTTDSWKILTEYPTDKSGWATAFTQGNNAFVGTGLHPVTFDFNKDFYGITPGTNSVWELEGKVNTGVYPNPFSQYLYFSLPANMDEMKINITDITGKNRGNYTVTFSQPYLDLAFLPSGVYFIHTPHGVAQAIKP